MTTRVEMLEGFPKNLIVCEAGVRHATYSKFINEIMQPSFFHLIDMKDSKKIKKFITGKPNIKFHLGKFNEVIQELGTIDMVYIDGMHDYENVMNDLKTFDPITKRWIAGHDWIPEGEYNFETGHEFRVREAVEDWLKDKNYYLTFITDDLSNINHDPDAAGGKFKLYSFVVSKTKADHDLFLSLLRHYFS